MTLRKTWGFWVLCLLDRFKFLIMDKMCKLTSFHSRKTTQLKNGQRTRTDTSPGGQTKGPETYEKMFSITSHQRDEN